MQNINLDKFTSLPEDILTRLYEETPINETLGLEEYLKLPVNEFYKRNKLDKELNSNIIIKEISDDDKPKDKPEE